MTRVFYASTLFGAMSLVAALDDGIFGPRDERRLLIVSDNVAIPELSTSFVQARAFAPLRDRFDEIVNWNDLIAPLHPSRWTPRAAEIPMLSRLVVDRLGLHDGVRELVLESVAVAPARTIGTLIRDCPVTVYSDGLMSQGPTREELPPEIGRRAGRLLYLDLVPSLTPLLLRELETIPMPLPDESFRRVVADLPSPEVGDAHGAPVVLGQYLSQLGIITEADELALHEAMIDGLAARGHRRIVFRPHPAANQLHAAPLLRHAATRDVELVVPDDGLPAEAWFAAARPTLVVSCFSTALLTARRFYGLDVATMGLGDVLPRLTPFENSNRIPATIVDVLVPALHPDGSIAPAPTVDLNRLVGAVGFCMQARRLDDLRESTREYVAEHGYARYFKRRRLEALGLLARPVRTSSRKQITSRRLVRAARRRATAASALVRRSTAPL